MQDYRDREPGLTKYVAVVVAALIVGVVAIALYGRYTETHPPTELKYTVSAVPQETATTTATRAATIHRCTDGCTAAENEDDTYQTWVLAGYPDVKMCNAGRYVTDLKDCPEYKVKPKRQASIDRKAASDYGSAGGFYSIGGGGGTPTPITALKPSDYIGYRLSSDLSGATLKFTQHDEKGTQYTIEAAGYYCKAQINNSTPPGLDIRCDVQNSTPKALCVGGADYHPAPCPATPAATVWPDPSAKAPDFTDEERTSALRLAMLNCAANPNVDVMVILPDFGWHSVACAMLQTAVKQALGDQYNQDDPPYAAKLPNRTQQ